MKPHALSDFIRKTPYLLAAVLAGLCLFLNIFIFGINRTVMNMEFHRYLFEKNDIYGHVYEVINASMPGFLKDLEKSLPDDVRQQVDLAGMLESSVTSDMVKTNLDSLRDGLFQYFSGQSMFLPEIYFEINPSLYTENRVQTNNQLDMAVQAFSKIDRINLSAVLLYLNRNDISDLFLFIKFIYYVFNTAPGILLLIALLLFFIGLILSRKPADISRWASILSASCGIAGFLSGSGLILYIYIFMKGAAYPLTASLPLEGEVIVSYIRECMLPSSVFTLASGLIFCIISIVLHYAPSVLPSVFSGKSKMPQKVVVLNNNVLQTLKLTAYVFLCLLIVSFISLKLQSFKRDYEANNFASAVEKMRNSNKITQVISAKDEAIYTVNIKLIDKETEEPVPGIMVDINGESASSGKKYDLTSITDETGTARFTVDKGNFKASFVSTDFPREYQMPSPFFFEMKTAGTTIITIRLERQPVLVQDGMGIIEIEVLGKDNKPLEGLELTLGEVVLGLENDTRYNVFSYTNSEGIAVFKVAPGTYSASFTESGLIKSYVTPSPFEVTAAQGSIARYTIRLAEP
ncbi:MSCRAMM family protein [Clostridium thermosuccinogenes]|uniref:MSCRAMM family protein n=1 Tax=Clostridium thermosuccinogenes TaxID=84032 RepID=UPI000CCBF1C5|nr:hypothetical protein [Pseudoclostridium thermosuccinogenes]PNT93508.1 hypothetical protein CDQ83_08410 [Pseudoclostridium thermosuccinogenes]